MILIRDSALSNASFLIMKFNWKWYVSERAARSRNLAVEAPRPEIVEFDKIVN